ncbi:hypothetical protein SAMN05444161_4516 [Rhizobiales bacterium GAS191]|jgi:hypothetical protein|nr:hypothetical protein SAMN05519103_03810 [Rhizobiales bacterium GAS113]SED97016.1 hypothetical protein SAMN05444161_4516 [Rhizobiales bacterium GAS191]SEE51350.1 hypothetical protein SAMN05519104_6356 [Rhizobiales bacterium GAS188]
MKENAEDKHTAWQIAVEALLIELMLRSACSETDPQSALTSLGVLALDNIGGDDGEPRPREKRDAVHIIGDLTRRAKEEMTS